MVSESEAEEERRKKKQSEVPEALLVRTFSVEDASAALANENRMRRERGFKGIGDLAAAISALCAAAKPQVDASTKAA